VKSWKIALGVMLGLLAFVGVIPRPEDQPIMSIEDAGAWLGLKRTASFEAARRGEIPTIALGRRRLVATALLRKMVGLDDVGLDDDHHRAGPAPTTRPGPGSPPVVLPFQRGRRLDTSP
jgi:hypothetical protein